MLTVKMRHPSTCQMQLWELNRRIFQCLDKLIEQSPVVTYDTEHVCPHCILTGRPSDQAVRRPLEDVMRSRCGKDVGLAENCDNADVDGRGTTAVPTALLFPLAEGWFALLQFVARTAQKKWKSSTVLGEIFCISPISLTPSTWPQNPLQHNKHGLKMKDQLKDALLRANLAHNLMHNHPIALLFSPENGTFYLLHSCPVTRTNINHQRLLFDKKQFLS